MAESRSGFLALGVFLIIIVVTLLLTVAQIIDWFLFIPVVLVLSGCWTLVIAATRSNKQQKYAPDPFSTMSLGLVMIALGGAWYLFPINWIYSVALLLLVFGVLAIAAALRNK
jgi:cobalamin synthase